jgi:D-sedoheptulose 7-phosphate isomerase
MEQISFWTEAEVSGSMQFNLLAALSSSIEIMQRMHADPEFAPLLLQVCEVCVASYRKGGKLLIAGNGGSAADAQHFAGELVSRFEFDRPPLAAIALTTDTSILTAIGNDYGYRDVFSRQILAHGRHGDIFVAISTSGNSGNVLDAIAAARKIGLTIIGLSGQTGGEMKALCDYCICAPSRLTPRIQECHLVIEHTICGYIEEAIFGDSIVNPTTGKL